MARKKTGLGRGLDAILPNTPPVQAPTDTPSGVMEIFVRDIRPNPRQPRTAFRSEELEELAQSIREHGVIQPLIVTSDDERPGKYLLIAGERRFRASQIAKRETVPVIVREASEQGLLELALIENVQRADLNALEAAEAYRQLAMDFKLSQDEIAKRVGKSRVSITNTLRLLKLAAPVQQALLDRKITEGHARALLGLPNEEAQTKIMEQVVERKLSVRDTESLVRKLTSPPPPKKSKPQKAPELKAIQDKLESQLGTKVTVNPSGKGGKLILHYYDDEGLNTLLDLLGGTLGD